VKRGADARTVEDALAMVDHTQGARLSA
jgi:hypothetical protein